MACWVAMSDTDSENGGLCVIAGSHRAGLRTTHITSGEEHKRWTTQHLMRDRSGKEWTEEMYSFEIDDLEPDELVPLQVPPGGGATPCAQWDAMPILRRFRGIRAASVRHLHEEESWLNG